MCRYISINITKKLLYFRSRQTKEAHAEDTSTFHNAIRITICNCSTVFKHAQVHVNEIFNGRQIGISSYYSECIQKFKFIPWSKWRGNGGRTLRISWQRNGRIWGLCELKWSNRNYHSVCCRTNSKFLNIHWGDTR